MEGGTYVQQGHDLPEGLTHSWNDVNGRTFDFSGRTSDQILQDGRVARAAVHAQCSWDPNVGGTGTEDQQQGDRPKIHTAPQWERPLKSTRRMSLLEANVLDERMRQFLHAGFFSFTGKEQQQLHRATNYCFLSSIACGVVTAVASRRITPLAGTRFMSFLVGSVGGLCLLWPLQRRNQWECLMEDPGSSAGAVARTLLQGMRSAGIPVEYTSALPPNYSHIFQVEDCYKKHLQYENNIPLVPPAASSSLDFKSRMSRDSVIEENQIFQGQQSQKPPLGIIEYLNTQQRFAGVPSSGALRCMHSPCSQP